jgi:hypothetical protein
MRIIIDKFSKSQIQESPFVFHHGDTEITEFKTFFWEFFAFSVTLQ